MPTQANPTAAAYPNATGFPVSNAQVLSKTRFLETSLWPFDPDFSETGLPAELQVLAGARGGTREVAHVQIHSPLGLRDNDPYILWGLLGATLDRGESNELVATQYWMRNYLGLHHGKTDYVRFASALERIAMTGYMNQAFWNPLQEEYQRVALTSLALGYLQQISRGVWMPIGAGGCLEPRLHGTHASHRWLDAL